MKKRLLLLIPLLAIVSCTGPGRERAAVEAERKSYLYTKNLIERADAGTLEQDEIDSALSAFFPSWDLRITEEETNLDSEE